MKKNLKFILNLFLVFTTVSNVIACQWSCTDFSNQDDFNQTDISCDYIVPDLKDRTKKIISNRGDVASLKKYISNYNNKWLNLTSKKIEFIDNLESKINYSASSTSINNFNALANDTSNFKNLLDLQNQFNNCDLGKTFVNIKWNDLLNQLVPNITQRIKIENQLCRFYNILAEVYGKENTLRMLYRIGTQKIAGSIVAYVLGDEYCDSQSCSFIQVMSCGQQAFNQNMINNSYYNGWWSSNNIMEVIVHEYGHVLGNFMHLNLYNRNKINSLADSDANHWWNSTYNTNNLKLSSKLNDEKGIDDDTNYMISSLAQNTKITVPVYQKLLAFGIVRSNYGRTSHRDLFAEAFSQWIDTEDDQRNIAWEKLDKFFRIDLPKSL